MLLLSPDVLGGGVQKDWFSNNLLADTNCSFLEPGPCSQEEGSHHWYALMLAGTFLDPKGAIYGGDLCKVFIYSDRVPPYAQLGCARQTFLVVILGVTLMCLRHMFLLLWVMVYAGSQSAPIYCRSSKIPANKNPYENVWKLLTAHGWHLGCSACRWDRLLHVCWGKREILHVRFQFKYLCLQYTRTMVQDLYSLF